MRHINNIALATAILVAAASAATPARADISGSVNATITLEAGCIINGQSLGDGASNADFGTIDFGTHNSLFTTADGQILSGGGAMQIQCSPGIAPTLRFLGGDNDGAGAGAGARAMAHSSTPGQFVTYNLYSDAGRTTVIPIGGGVALAPTGAVQSVNIYGRAFGEAGLTSGSYGDTVTVLLEL